MSLPHAIILLSLTAVVLSYVLKGIEPPRTPIWGFIVSWGMALSMGGAVILLIIYLFRSFA